MSLIELVVLLVIAGVCGSLGQTISGFSRGGCIVSIVLGFIGALLGHWLSSKLDLPEILPLSIGGTTFPVVWAIIGSTLFVAVIGFLTKNKRRS